MERKQKKEDKQRFDFLDVSELDDLVEGAQIQIYKYKYFISHFLINYSRKNIYIYMADNNKVLKDVMTEINHKDNNVGNA